MNITPYHPESKKAKYSHYYFDTPSVGNNFQTAPEDSDNDNFNRSNSISTDPHYHHHQQQQHHDYPVNNFERMQPYNDPPPAPPPDPANYWLTPPALPTATVTTDDSDDGQRLPRGYDPRQACHPAMPISHTQNIMNMLHSNHLRRYEYEDFKTACKILNGREARNRAEKNRRDKLNGSIQELSTMVPHVAESPRRVDKTAVLRFSAHGLRINYVFGNSNGKNRLSIKPQTSESLVKLIKGFLLTVTCRGQIVLVSPSVEQYLGHCQTDLFGQNILNITHPDDHALLKQQLIPTDLVKMFELSSTGLDNNNDSTDDQRSHKTEDDIDAKLKMDRRDFTIRLARAGPRSEPTSYELVRIDGCFRRADQSPKGSKFNACASGLQILRRTRCRDDGIPLHSISGNDIVLIGMARIIKQPNICDRLMEACKFEYKTRHLIDGRIVQCDQRISIVAGYLTDEVSGLSPFTFMHKDDVRWVMVALRQMYDNSAIGESCYRLMTRTGQFIYLKTRGYLEVDNVSNKAHSFVCINSLVTEDEGKKLVREMKKNFSVLVNSTSDLAIESDVPTVENPHEIERAILNLITNLQPGESEVSDTVDIKPEVAIHTADLCDDSSQPRTTKSPPLLIIAPNTSTIKTTITKSMAIVETNKGVMVAAEHIIKMDGGEDNSIRPSVLQRTVNFNSTANELNQFYQDQQHQQQQMFDFDFNHEIKIEPSSSPMPIKHESHLMSPLSIAPDSPMLYSGEEQYGHPHHASSSVSHGFQHPPAYDPQLCSPPFYAPTPFVEGKRSARSQMKRGHEGYGSLESAKKRHSEVDSAMLPFRDLNDSTKTDLMHALPKSFQALDRSLADIEDATCTLKEQCNNYAVDSHKQKINEIIEEHQQQKEILQSIQEEFETQISSPSSTMAANTCTTTTSGIMGDTAFGDKPKHLGADKNNQQLVNRFDDSGKTRPS